MTEFAHPSPFLKGNFAPVLVEMDAEDLPIVSGAIPAGLEGTLFRNGSNAMYPPLTDDHHWFLAEGMVHAIRFHNGRVSYRNRWVRTRQYTAQREAGKRLVATGLVDPSHPDIGDLQPHFAATHALVHGGKLLALDEWYGPAALDPETLETLIPEDDFEGKHVGAFTAHPKIDPDTGEMFGFGYQSAGVGSAEMSYTVLDKDGKVTRHDRFPVPYCSIAHDFAITKEHVVFPVFSANIDLERAAAGGVFGGYDPSLPTYFGIMRRDGDVRDMRWFKGPSTFAFHTMNAYTEYRDGRPFVVVDMMKMDGLPLFPRVDTGETPTWLGDLAGKPVRWTFDLEGNGEGYTEDEITDLTGDFCLCDDRYVAKKYTQGFYAARKEPWTEDEYFDTVSHINVETHERRDYTPGGGFNLLEPIFVARSADAPEGDGWLLTVVHDKKTDSSEVHILDTTDIRKGPVARIGLPNRVPFGFHGSWYPAAKQ